MTLLSLSSLLQTLAIVLPALFSAFGAILLWAYRKTQTLPKENRHRLSAQDSELKELKAKAEKQGSELQHLSGDVADIKRMQGDIQRIALAVAGLRAGWRPSSLLSP